MITLNSSEKNLVSIQALAEGLRELGVKGFDLNLASALLTALNPYRRTISVDNFVNNLVNMEPLDNLWARFAATNYAYYRRKELSRVGHQFAREKFSYSTFRVIDAQAQITRAYNLIGENLNKSVLDRESEGFKRHLRHLLLKANLIEFTTLAFPTISLGKVLLETPHVDRFPERVKYKEKFLIGDVQFFVYKDLDDFNRKIVSENIPVIKAFYPLYLEMTWGSLILQ